MLKQVVGMVGMDDGQSILKICLTLKEEKDEENMEPNNNDTEELKVGT